jgi:DNA polymerase sigma
LIESEVVALKIPSKWELVLFGSYSVDFAIKKSDLDLVLIVKQESPEKVIYRLCEHLRATKWLRNCSIVEGKISILEF